MKFDDATVERVACALAITLRRMNFDATLARKALDALTPEDLVRALGLPSDETLESLAETARRGGFLAATEPKEKPPVSKCGKKISWGHNDNAFCALPVGHEGNCWDGPQ